MRVRNKRLNMKSVRSYVRRWCARVQPKSCVELFREIISCLCCSLVSEGKPSNYCYEILLILQLLFVCIFMTGEIYLWFYLLYVSFIHFPHLIIFIISLCTYKNCSKSTNIYCFAYTKRDISASYVVFHSRSYISNCI